MRSKILLPLCVLAVSVSTSFAQLNKYNSFEEMIPRTLKYYHDNQLDSAILLAEYAYKTFPAEEEDAITFLGELYSRNAQYKKATDIWKTGHEKGYCFGLDNPSYDKYYKENSDFKELASVERNWYQNSHIEHEVVLPTAYDKDKKYPLVFVLHGNSSNMKWAQESWLSEVMQTKYISVFVQSYAFSNKNKGEYKWKYNDEKTIKELRSIYENVTESFPVNRNKIVFSGMSAGGYLVLQLAFDELIPMSGLVVNCPVVPKDISDNAISNFVAKKKRIGLITGENDFAIANQKMLMEKIDKQGGQNKLCINKDKGHEYVEEFSALLDDYLEWIIE